MTDKRYCSFCGAEQAEVKRMISALRANICDSCVDLCYDILNDTEGEDALEKLRQERSDAAGGESK